MMKISLVNFLKFYTYLEYLDLLENITKETVTTKELIQITMYTIN